MTLKHLNKESIQQYQTEERTLMAFRLASARYRIKDLLDIMSKDTISTQSKVEQLSKELAAYFHHASYAKCRSMGQLVKTNMKHLLQKSLGLVPKLKGRYED